MAFAPGQLGGKEDNGTFAQYHGWVLLFDLELIYGSAFEQNLSKYHFFSYNTNESLKLTADEMEIANGLMEAIRNELINQKPFSIQIIQDYILLLADYSNRFYERQFQTNLNEQKDILMRFQDLLQKYYKQGEQRKHGIPTVKYCADRLFMSASYFGDMIRKSLGESPIQYIRHFIIDHAKTLMALGKTVTETAYALGFEYPQHFTRIFKKETSISPSRFLSTLKSKG